MVDVYVKKLFYLVKKSVMQALSKISTQKKRNSAKIPRINFGFKKDEKQDGAKS